MVVWLISCLFKLCSYLKLHDFSTHGGNTGLIVDISERTTALKSEDWQESLFLAETTTEVCEKAFFCLYLLAYERDQKFLHQG